MERTQPRYWCHQCKQEFESNSQDIKCVKCQGEFYEQITPENNPVGYVPYEVRRQRPRNLTRRIQQNWIINHGPGPIFAFPNMEVFENNYLSNVLQYLRRTDPNRYGSPPASKAQIQKLEKFQFDSKHFEQGEDECSICKEKFQQGDKVMRMPCKHLDHQECLIPWLSSHNSCPQCRFELKTDDPDYEERRRNRPQ